MDQEPSDQLPAVPAADVTTADVTEAFARQHPLHALLGRVLEDCGGYDYILEWAEDNPDKFIPMMLKLAPVPNQGGGGSSGGVTLNLNLPESLGPGPLDVTPTDGST